MTKAATPGTDIVPASTTALVADPWAELASGEWAPDGTENIRIKWPELKIVTGVSKMENKGKHGGEFWHSDSEKFEASVEVIPLTMTFQQSLFADQVDSPLCMSIDGVAPLPAQPLWRDYETFKPRGGSEVPVPDIDQPKLCAQCPFMQFQGDNRPLCSRSILLMLQRTEDQSFAQLRLPASSLAPWAAAVNKHLVKGSRRLPLYTGVWTLRTKEVTKGSNTFYVIDVESVRPQSLEEARMFSNMISGMREEMERVQYESVARQDSDPDNVIDHDDRWNDIPAASDDDLPFE